MQYSAGDDGAFGEFTSFTPTRESGMKCVHCGIYTPAETARIEPEIRCENPQRCDERRHIVCADCYFISTTTESSQYLEAIQFLACLSEGEAKACWRDYVTGLEWSSEAVNHFGGTKAVMDAAFRHLQRASELNIDYSLPPSVRWAARYSCWFNCGRDITQREVFYRQAIFSWEWDQWVHLGCTLREAFDTSSAYHPEADVIVREFTDMLPEEDA
jgi:hypothetical protein